MKFILVFVLSINGHVIHQKEGYHSMADCMDAKKILQQEYKHKPKDHKLLFASCQGGNKPNKEKT